MIKLITLATITALLLISAAAQTTTVYQIGPYFCQSNVSCTVYNPDETMSLQWDSAPNADFVVFDLNSWQPSFHNLNSYNCGGAGNNPAPTFTSATDGSCSGLDSNGVAFSMTWTVNLTPYRACGRGGCRTYYHVNSATIAVTQ